MLFSQRYKYKKVRETIQKESIDDKTRTKLWNLWIKSDFGAIEQPSIYYRNGSFCNSDVNLAHELYWTDYFENNVDERPIPSDSINYIKGYFFKCAWNEVYDFLESTLHIIQKINSYFNESFNKTAINNILETELSAYRVVNNLVVETTSESEIKLIEETLDKANVSEFNVIHNHLDSAFCFLYNRKSPDYKKTIEDSTTPI